MKAISNTISMKVVKRDGRKAEVSFDKVLRRISRESVGLAVNPTAVAREVLGQIHDGVKTTELDEFAATLCANISTQHPDYGKLAARLTISNHQKNTDPSFLNVMRALSNQKMPKTTDPVSYIDKDLMAFVEKNAEAIDARIDHERDYLFDYFGFKTLEKSYLLKDANGKILERPQHLWMRVSLALWFSSDLERAFETYDYMSQKYFTHATPTLFNAGTQRQQLSSCFLLSMNDDSIAGIYKTLGDCALISKYAGGIGIHCHNVRAKGSLIKGTNGTSNGLVPMLRVFNNTARYVDQCFTPDTLVFTDSGPKVIEDIGVTDKVLTSNGEYKNVNLPVRHEYKGPMLDIQIKQGVYPVRVTPEHQILALKNQEKGLNYDVIRNRLNKNLAKAEFVDANELLKNDFLVFPIPQYSKDIITITEADCRMYGILLGDGYISKACSGVSLNENSKKKTFDFVMEYLTNRGIKTSISRNDEKTSTQIRWSTANAGFKFTRAQLYKESDGQLIKQVDSAFIHLPKEKILQLLKGIIESDGCIGTKEISLELTSYPLIEAVRYMVLRLGGLCSGYERNRVGNVSTTRSDIITKLPTAVLRIPRIPEIIELFPNSPASEYFTFMRHNDNIYTRIETITEVEYDGIVHDFEIEDPHDYVVAHLGVAHNGGGKRNGSFAMYLEPWHADIEDFLRLKLNNGAEEDRARDLFYALWIPDLFMERVEANADWTVFCPNEAPGLADAVGDDFKKLYTTYEAEGRGRKTISAQKLWFQILDSQMETGTPYLCYKDPSNKKSNQQNLGTIKSSNLCTEIIEYSDANESAVCNLASIGLPAFVKGFTFDFDKLRQVTKVVVRNLNRVIDINFYPTPETKRSNMRHRPIGLGIQGLADVFAILKLSWDSPAAADLNQRIFEHMYYAALETSYECAQVEGPYETFQGSPMSKGLLQPDLWNVKPLTEDTLDWSLLRQKAKTGIRNSLLVAPMPTASTSQILGYNECFEPFNSNLYTRRTLAGEYIVVNKYLLNELMDLGLWDDNMKQQLIIRNGSVQGIDAIPQEIQERYKTVYEMKQKTIIDMAAARGAFICQSQSLNLFVADATYAKLTSMHFYAWKQGLKTGCYYLRTKSPVMAQKFTIDPRMIAGPVINDKDECVSDSDTDDEETPEQRKVRERTALKERLAREYEEEAKKAKEAAEKGEGCLMCSG